MCAHEAKKTLCAVQIRTCCTNKVIIMNEVVNILKEQADLLKSKTNGKVKAVFSEVKYANKETNYESNSEFMKYKFEIYNDRYRFRLFTIDIGDDFPLLIHIDEGIGESLLLSGLYIYSVEYLCDLVRGIFHSQKVRSVINKMMSEVVK